MVNTFQLASEVGGQDELKKKGRKWLLVARAKHFTCSPISLCFLLVVKKV